MFNLPTREQCQEIVKNSEVFYCIETEVEGFTVEMYNYRLASYNDFEEHNAFELRGLTFIKHPTGTWERYLLMNKFFNVNQCQNWLENDLKDKKVVRVQDKLDGSIISFVRLPNGVIRAKSKMSFDSEQAQMAQEVYDKDIELQEFIKDCFEDNITPIFELVSPFNQIVLEYSETELVLLQMRYSSDGTYMVKERMNYIAESWNIKSSQDFEVEKIEHIISKYDKYEIIQLLKDKKFSNLSELFTFLYTTPYK